jgi:hypothetical protein
MYYLYDSFLKSMQIVETLLSADQNMWMGVKYWSKPRFQYIRRLHLNVPLHLHVISGDHLVLLDDEMHIYLWNLTSNKAITWKLAGLDPVYNTCISLPFYFLPTSIIPFTMDIEKVYLGADRLSVGRRALFYARVALLPITFCCGQLSQLWALSGDVLDSLMRMEGEKEGEGEDEGNEEGSEEQSEVGSEGSEGGHGEGCLVVMQSLYTYGLQDRVLYDFFPASGRLVATHREICVLDFLVPVPDLYVFLSFFDLSLKVNNFFLVYDTNI